MGGGQSELRKKAAFAWEHQFLLFLLIFHSMLQFSNIFERMKWHYTIIMVCSYLQCWWILYITFPYLDGEYKISYTCVQKDLRKNCTKNIIINVQWRESNGRISFKSWSLLLQQFPACLVRLIWMILAMCLESIPGAMDDRDEKKEWRKSVLSSKILKVKSRVTRRLPFR